jgi:Protein of unknown function (DUF2510)
MGAVVVLVWVACAALGYTVGKGKGRATEGLVLGLLLGIIGLIIIACLSPKPLPYGSAPFGQAPPVYGLPVPQQPYTPPAPAGQWMPDPSGGHQLRWWDGSAWTQHVSDNGVASVEMPAALFAKQPPSSPPSFRG